MSLPIASVRLPTVLIVAGSLLLPALAAPASASAGTLYACVRTHTGATRFVAKRSRCRRGENRLSWNTAGPAGPTGPAGSPGSPGAPGAAGAVAGFTATNNGLVPVVPAAQAVPVTKTLPPGSYIVSAKAIAAAESATPGKHSQLTCAITDTPGTVRSPEAIALDLSAWVSPLAEVLVGNAAEATLSMQTPLTAPVTSTVALVCASAEELPGVTIGLLYSQLSVVQTSRNG